ncbi:hypothetical protein ACIRST_05430 [Kitasatospora sp. NPDC101447]|uniref:hypothetical protein n=1 Tax=Kitasatospora sp. NPDC101447 TaxID=3364102 RepID=UPI0037F6C925
MRIRSIAAALAVAGAAVLATASVPASAHGDTVHLEITGADNGHVATTATFENDHDPVTEGFAGSLAATSSDGRTVGPWRLVAVPGHPGSYTTREILPAGHWKITVDCAFPDLGHGERELDVQAAAISDPVGSVPTTAPTSGPTTAPTPAPTSGPTTVPSPVVTLGPTADPTAPAPTDPTTSAPAGTSAPATASATASASATATSGARPKDSADDDGSTAAAWAAVGTAAVAVVLVVLGFRLRRKATRG